MLKVFCLLVMSFLCSTAISAPWKDLQPLLPKGTQVSYLVVDTKKNKLVANFQEETLRTPASVQKLLTATAAKLYLGENYHYKTTIEGNRKFIKKGKFSGNLNFYFTGDPTFTRKHIREMLQRLKNLGIRRIEGDFLLNNSHFNGYQWSDGQAWNDLGVCYTAPSNAIVVNRNCVLGNLSLRNKNSKKATLFIPKYEPVNMTSNVAVVTKAQKEKKFCALEMIRHSHNTYHLLGCILPRKAPLPLAFAINDPAAYAQQVVTDELKSIGIKLLGKVLIDSRVKGRSYQSVLVSHNSPQLDELLNVMMKKSDNLIADSLFKTIGGRYYKQQGNFRNGTEAVKAILKAKGLDLENAYIADGSGLSRHNLMSTELFMSVMQFVYANDKKLKLMNTFSVSGVDGTLKYHKGVNAKILKGKVIAKTGSLKGVANLVGVVKAPSGDKLFVLMINGYNKDNSSVDADIPRDPEASLYLFEKAFFNKIYNGKSVH